MFTRARLKLTIWYLLIIMVVSGLFSAVIYSGIDRELNHFERLTVVRREDDFFGTRIKRVPAFNPTEVAQTRQRLILTLLLINLGILATSAISGYFLAGKTLRPIKDMIDDQNRFVADASHELRTPLTAMKTEIEVALRQKSLTAQQAKSLLKSNLEEVAKMQNLSNYLLSLNRHNQKSAAMETVNLTQVARAVIDKLQPLAKHRKINFTAQLSDAQTFGDKDSLSELMTILIENAIKYSHDGGEIKIKLIKEGTHSKFSVQDFGVGIKPGDETQIFKRFFRSDSARTKSETNGYGLGLSIAQKIVQMHHGTISVESKINEGSTFTVNFSAIK